jgi:adenylate kinase
MVNDVVLDRLDTHDWNYGFVLDGVMARILSRRLCSNCGLDYNLILHRPAREDECDVCKRRLVARADDHPEAVRERLADYHAKTKPILELFRRKELVLTVDGTRSVAEIQAEIRKGLGLEPQQA